MHRVTFRSLTYYQFSSLHPYPELAHGVFTRLGGHSQSPWNSLNMGYSVGDDPALVDANHVLVCQALGFQSKDDITSPHQVHGAKVGIVDDHDKGKIHPEADALITQIPGILLMLRFADCTPIVLYDPQRWVVGLAHAGWRGTVLKIAHAVVESMVETFSCRPSDIIAGIGPSIGPCCYQVGQNVIDAAHRAFPDTPGLLVQQPAGRVHFDLWAANRQQLDQVGVAQIEICQDCTACHTNEWFSHRAERGQTGRFAVAIGLRPS